MTDTTPPQAPSVRPPPAAFNFSASVQSRSPESAAPPADRDPAVVDCAVYVDGRRMELREPHHALQQAEAAGGFVWLGLHEPSEAELATIAARYGLHPLAVEDAIDAHQRPKLEPYGEGLFMVFKTARYVEHAELTATSDIVETGEVSVFVGPHYVITVRHGEHGGLAPLRHSLEGQPDLLRLGPSAVLYAIADHVVDTFVDVTAAVEDDVDELEASVFSSDRVSGDIARLYQLKRELLQLRRAVAPLEVPLQKLAERQIDVVPEEMRTYFRDVEDHAIRIRDGVAALDELLTSILQASLARSSQIDNEDMRKISAWAGIIAVPTAIAGIYGMNFRWMPELSWHYGYFVVLALIFLTCFLLYRGFKRNGWL